MKNCSRSVLDVARDQARSIILENISNSERNRLLKRRKLNLLKDSNNKVNSQKVHSTSVNSNILDQSRAHARKTIQDNINKYENIRMLKTKNKDLLKKITRLEEALYLENPLAQVPLSSDTKYKSVYVQKPLFLHYKFILFSLLSILLALIIILIIIWSIL